uniref:Secreted protein n=1 Tax=Bos indicus x Bos taurus TaxID=30522 RepID=A0A4W2GLC0_BOBOX
HLNLCRPRLLLLSIFSSISVFSNESALHIRCHWNFVFLSLVGKEQLVKIKTQHASGNAQKDSSVKTVKLMSTSFHFILF